MFTIIDIETTGYNKETDILLEVAYTRIDGFGNIIGNGAMWFYDPEYDELDKKIDTSDGVVVNGLDSKFLSQHEKYFYVNLAHLCTVINREYLIGKNLANFDIKFLADYLRNRLIDVKVELPVPKGYVDLQEIYTPIFRKYYMNKHGEPTRKMGTLEDYMEIEGFSEEDIKQQYLKMFGEIPERELAPHSAMYDVTMTYLALKSAIDKHGLELIKR